MFANRRSFFPFKIGGILSILLFTYSCGLFETRDPEEPGSTTVPVFIQPNRPQDVVQNLIHAVRALNVDNYRRCFNSENFEYEPSSAAQNSNSNLWQSWGFSEEEVYFNNMRSETEGLSGHDLHFDNQSFIQINSDEERFEADYVITINHNRQEELPREARGRIRLLMHRDVSGLLTIQSWNDAANGSDFTWSDFRAAFIQL